MTKPREFQILYKDHLLRVTKAVHPDTPVTNGEYIHVIEYSAYKNAMAHSDHSCAVARAAYNELAEAKALLKDHENDWKRIQDAERELATFKQRLSNTYVEQVEKELAEAKAELGRLERIDGYCRQSIAISTIAIKDRDRWKEQAEKLAEALNMECPKYVVHPQAVWFKVHQGRVMAEFEKFKKGEINV